ncbi:TraB/GumN family protein [Paenibacillus daejeonensis]|uniref:TraB/GumN family protein n=1 Tax=Paenibacillus daejeonensis TaxID=135193 RepID=UPI00036DB85A|nr:TraB/GumN family protein [Paenibacillus daejeonensis]
MKKITSLCLSLVLMFSVMGAVAAQERAISLWYGENQVELGGHQPVIQEGVTLVPVKPLFDQMNLELGWDGATKTVTGQNDNLTISLQVGETTATINGTEVTLPIAAASMDNVTYVPVRALGEAAGYRVLWDPEQRAIQLLGATAPAPGEEVVEGEGSKGFLWQVEDANSTVYLLGSIHVADESMYPLRTEIEEAYAASDYLAVELDIAMEDATEFEELMFELGMYQDGTTLSDHIPADTYAALGEVLEAEGLDADAFDMFKPWVIATTIDSLQIGEAGYDGEMGIDMHFLNQAKASNLPILELESAALQLNMFNDFSEELQLELLEGSIAGYHAGPDENAQYMIDHMIQMWVDGDQSLLTEMTEGFSISEEYNKAMLIDRNIGMVDKIKEYLEDEENKTYFVVVGAAHMVGADGIVTLLREQGYTVTEL